MTQNSVTQNSGTEPAVDTIPPRPGYDALWEWFGLSYATWLTLPRVLMHEMPDVWQSKMADLLNEFDETWGNAPDLSCHVMIKEGNRFVKMPAWVEYRHPDREFLETFKTKR